MTTISATFVANFEAEVYAQYLEMGSKLRNTVRTQNHVQPDHSVEFQGCKMRVACLLADYYAGDWVDDMEAVTHNYAEQQIIAKASAYTLGRKSDELIVDAMAGAEHTVAENDITDTIEVAHTLLSDGCTPDDGQRFAIVGWKQWSELLGIDEFAEADYIGSDELPWKGTQAKRWLNTIWLPCSGLPLNGNVRSCFWYHRTAVGHAISDRVMTDFTWHGDRAAFFVNNRMAQGACLIDPSRVVRMQCIEK